MNSLIDYVIRAVSWLCVFVLAAIAGWMFGSGALASGDHQILSIATSVVAGLAVMTAVVPVRNPDSHSPPGTGDRGPIERPHGQLCPRLCAGAKLHPHTAAGTS